MEKTNNKASPKDRGCRKFFYRAVSVSIPTMRCPFQQKQNNATTAQAKKQQSPSIGPSSNKLLNSTAAAAAPNSSGHVPITFEPSYYHKPSAATAAPPVANKHEHVKFVQPAEVKIPVEATDHQKPRAGGVLPHAFTEYIDRAGAKIRRTTTKVTDGGVKDSFNNKVSDYITRTKHRFHVPSYAADTTEPNK